MLGRVVGGAVSGPRLVLFSLARHVSTRPATVRENLKFARSTSSNRTVVI